MDDKNTYKNIDSMKNSRISANILALPGPLLCSFSIYIILSYFLVPFKITAPLSTIMFFIMFGLTNHYSKERINLSGAENKIFRNKFYPNLVFATVYATVIISSFFNNQNPESLFIPWSNFTGIQIVNLGIATCLSIFMPGYALATIFDRKNELKTLPKFLIAYLLSTLVTGFAGYIWGVLGFAVSDIKPILLGIHLVILVLFVGIMVLNKKFDASPFKVNLVWILKQNSTSVLVFASLFALVIFSTDYLYSGTIIGDQWTHHGKSLVFSAGIYKDFTNSGTNEQSPPFMDAFLAAFFALSNIPSVNAYVSFNFLNIIPVISFYYFITKWIPNHSRAALLASTLFMLSSGFGWAYVLNLTNTHPITTQESAIDIFHLGGLRTFDIWTPNTFVDVGHPDITSPLIIFALPAGFVLLGLIKENMNSRLRYFAILFGIVILGYLAHDEFGLFIIVACITPLILKINGKNSLFAAIFTTVLFVILDVTFLSDKYYIYRKIFGVPLIILFFIFVSTMWALYASKIMHRVYNLKIIPSIMKKIINRETKMIIGIDIIFLFSYLYVFSFIIWNFTPTFDIRHHTDDFRIVPWYFYPLRFGATGLLGFVFILSSIFKRYEREVLVLAVLGIAAFLMSPYYSEFRFDKYIMIAFAGFASLLLFKILHAQNIHRSLVNGMIIGLVVTLSSLSVMMYVGYTAVALEKPDYTSFDQDLPRRHFPSDIDALNFLHNNFDMKTDNVALTQNEAIRYKGIASQIEGFIGLPLTKSIQSPHLLESSNLEGFYTLLDYNHMRYIVLSKFDIEQGLSGISSFALQNFPKSYKDNDYVILSVPPSSPPSSIGNVALLLPDIQYPANSLTIFSNSPMDYKSNPLVLPNSKSSQVTRSEIVSGNHTLFFDVSATNVNSMESRFMIINQTSDDNHSGIIWEDGGTEFYSFLRSGKLSFYDAYHGEFVSADMNRENGVWYTLKIVYVDKIIQVFVNNELKLQITRNTSDIPNISKVGIRSYNSAAEFELLKVGQLSSDFNLKYNYYYPVSALALSKIKYETLSDQDSSKFSEKNVIITVDPLEESRYLEFVKNGGNITVLNSNGDLRGEFSKIMSLKPGGETEFDSIQDSGGIHLKITGTTRNLEINSTDSQVTSFYAKNGQLVAPFIIKKKYGNGTIAFVNVGGYFKAISQYPDQYFLTLGNIPKLFHLKAEKYGEGETNKTYLAQFAGDLRASGRILINGSSLTIPENDFYNLTAKQNDNYSTSPSLIYENGSEYVKIHDLNLYGPCSVSINSTNLLYVPSSEFGYATLSFPKGFDLTVKLANGSRAEFNVDDANNTSKVTSTTLQFKGVKIQPKHSQNVILMTNPEIMINGSTTFDKLYSTNPIEVTTPWADGVPITIGGRLIINIDHVDNDITDTGTSLTYFRWMAIDEVPDISRSIETIDIPWRDIMLSESNFILIGVLTIGTATLSYFILKNRKTQR